RPPGKSLGTFYDQSLVGTPISYLLRSTCSSADPATDVSRAAAVCSGTRARFAARCAVRFLTTPTGRDGRAPPEGPVKATTSSSLQSLYQLTMPFLRDMSANDHFVQASNLF